MSRLIEKAKIGNQEISIETGWVAKQAAGAVIVRSGETVVMVTVVGAKEARPDASFFPLSVEYRENAFASGKIPGGFFKREGRLSEHEILTCRLIDRPIRPLFPYGYRNETQVYAQVLSLDPEHDPDILAMTGASAALSISPLPFEGPVAGIRIGRIDGELVANPTQEQLLQSDMDVILVASKDAIMMVEGEAKEVPENELIEALFFGHDSLQPLLELQERLKKKAGKAKWKFKPATYDEALVKEVAKKFTKEVAEAYKVREKKDRGQALSQLKDKIKEHYLEKKCKGDKDAFAEMKKDLSHAIDRLKRDYVRLRTVNEHIRLDGRGLEDVRKITSEIGWLPRTHGSALFTRGETQASVTVTLGTSRDEQRVEKYGETEYRNFILHYNFPPYSVGEARPMRGPGRREIGHGNLAGRSIKQVLPNKQEFGYTIRVVSDITESNGSSSMASVCGGSLALMNAGVPLKSSIAGIAMGLIQEGDKIAILTDILGDEDHLGDMDFKITGTRTGICAIQMDIKIDGLTRKIMQDALSQANRARLHILDRMDTVIQTANPELSSHAPRIIAIYIKPDRIRDIIGPGGKIIRSIQEQTGVKIDLEDTGRVNIFSPDEEASQQAVDFIRSLTMEIEPGTTYLGTVTSVKEFGAFVEIFPGQEGMLHISEIHSERVERVEDILREGDEVLVKVTEVDQYGKFRLSRKAALAEQTAKRQEEDNKEEDSKEEDSKEEEVSTES